MQQGLIADIGGTNARFAIVANDGSLRHEQTLTCADYPSMVAAVDAYKNKLGIENWPTRAAISAAGPVIDGRVEVSNNPWTIDVGSLPFDDTLLVNDFEVVAHALPDVTDDQALVLRGGQPDAAKCLLALGPGTGLGVAARLPSGAVVTSEAGHTTFSAQNAEEDALLHFLREEYDFVEVEFVVSGRGLVALYHYFSSGKETITAADVTARAEAAKDPAAARALDMFFTILGRVAGDLVLTFNAQGGVFLAGGILPRIQNALRSSDFLTAMTDKGRFSDFVSAPPVRLITHPYPAFIGLARLLATHGQ